MKSTVFSLVYYLQNLDTNYSFLYLLSLIICERIGKKIIPRTHCFMHQSFFKLHNNDAYFLDFRALKFSLIFFNVNPFNINKPCILGFYIMKSNIKKAPVKFREDLLYFQHFMLIFVFVPNY